MRGRCDVQLDAYSSSAVLYFYRPFVCLGAAWTFFFGDHRHRRSMWRYVASADVLGFFFLVVFFFCRDVCWFLATVVEL